MSDKWTPGPWFESLYLGGVYEIRTGNRAWPKTSVCNEVYSRENAMLISAAPDLYKALYRLFDIANHFHVNGGYFSDDAYSYGALVAAEEALAEARGEKQ